jgi:hypothetical protein
MRRTARFVLPFLTDGTNPWRDAIQIGWNSWDEGSTGVRSEQAGGR